MLIHFLHSGVLSKMNFFTDVLATLLCAGRGNIFAVYAWSESRQIPSKYLNLCFENEQKSYGVEQHEGE